MSCLGMPEVLLRLQIRERISFSIDRSSLFLFLMAVLVVFFRVRKSARSRCLSEGGRLPRFFLLPALVALTDLSPASNSSTKSRRLPLAWRRVGSSTSVTAKYRKFLWNLHAKFPGNPGNLHFDRP